jgi:oligosaccharide repeat unit polymerase
LNAIFNYAFPIAWYIFLFIICWILEKLTKCFSNLNIFTIFIVTFIIYHGIGVPFNIDVNYEQMGLKMSDEVIVRWIFSLVLMYVSFVLGVIIAQDLFKKTNINLDKHPQSIPVSFRLGKTGLKSIFPWLSLIMATFLFVILWNPSLLIQSLASDLSADAYRASRVAYGTDNSSESSLLLRLANTLKFAALPFCTYSLFLVQKYHPKSKLVFWIVLIINILINLCTGQKAGVVEIAIGIFICNLLVTTNSFNQINKKTLIIVLLLLLTLIFVIFPFQYGIQYPDQSYQENLDAVLNRCSAESSRVLQLHFYVYPDVFPHLLGGSTVLFSTLFGNGKIMDPSRIIRSYIVFGHTDDATGSWNAAFIGTAWADFNYFGVIGESILATSILWYYHQWFVKQPKTAGVVGVYVTLAMSSKNLAETNFFTTLLTFGLVSAFLVYQLLKENHDLLPSQTNLEIKEDGSGAVIQET